jgi:hypothetical protein
MAATAYAMRSPAYSSYSKALSAERPACCNLYSSLIGTRGRHHGNPRTGVRLSPQTCALLSRRCASTTSAGHTSGRSGSGDVANGAGRRKPPRHARNYGMSRKNIARNDGTLGFLLRELAKYGQRYHCRRRRPRISRANGLQGAQC